MAIRFSEPHFLKGSNHLAIRRRSDAVNFTFWLSEFSWGTDPDLSEIEQSTAQLFTAKFLLPLRLAVTLTFDPLILNFYGRSDIMWSIYIPS